MLKKRYVYDFTALSRMLLPLILAILGVGVLNFGLTVLIDSLPENMVVLEISLTVLVIFLFVALIGGFIANTILTLYYYYKNFFSDEGYLTFTLPATTDQLLLGKVFAGILWTVIVTVVTLFAVFLSLLWPILQDMEEIVSFFEFFFEDVQFSAKDLPTLIPLLLLPPAEAIGTLMLGYTAITTGSLTLRRHKLLGAILFYVVFDIAVSTVQSILSAILPAVIAGAAANFDAAATSSLILTLVMKLGVIFGGYFLTRYLLKNKLNLE